MTTEKMIDAAQIRAARGLVDLDQRGLAELAGVTERTVIRAERETVSASTLAAIRQALERKGVEFIAENGGGSGVRLRKRARK